MDRAIRQQSPSLCLGMCHASSPFGSAPQVGSRQNTQAMLQRLSNSVMAVVLAPVLSDSIQESSSEMKASHARNNRIAAIALKAMDRWCLATDLSLAQIKHICSKVQVSNEPNSCVSNVTGGSSFSHSVYVPYFVRSSRLILWISLVTPCTRTRDLSLTPWPNSLRLSCRGTNPLPSRTST
jgi:hypothetical protein